MNTRLWWKRNSDDALREAFREGTIDAFGDEEQHESMFNVIEQELELPFEATLLGETITVVDVKRSDSDSLGIDLVCQKNGKRYPIAARSIELTGELPQGQVFLAAYLDWKSRF